jgi:hypothetical protein
MRKFNPEPVKDDCEKGINSKTFQPFMIEMGVV